ncbi:TVP38/TMEM64 family protein [Acidocella sp.]|uniref:TVP38/TMEM64 family protein n=1 Tax=Acidocella sp. TaxID=50710 RepID=UPI002607DC5E|nr:VTT domain-containing protein [Acidocella sp.]
MSQSSLPRADVATITAKALKPALMAGGLVAVAAALPLLGHGEAQNVLSGVLAQGGVEGQGLFLLLATFLTAIGLPRQIPAFAAGYAFGPLYGSIIALLAQVLACNLDFIWARAVGQSFIRRRFGERMAKVDKTLSRHTFATTLTLRLMPVGNNLLLNLAAGLSSVRLMPFLAASALGFVPQTVVFALFGHGSQPNHSHMLVLAGVMFAASVLLGVALFLRARRAA